MSEKQILRKELVQQRRLISNKENKIYSENIIDKVLELIKNKPKSQKIFSFIEFRNEVGISPIIQKLVSSGKEVYIPYLRSYEWKISKVKSCVGNKFDVDHQNLISSPKEAGFKKDDIIIVPGTAFSVRGERLGYGKGIYDRWLMGIDSIKLGVCFDFQLLESVPQETHDVKMDAVITEKRHVLNNKTKISLKVFESIIT